jgi:hypothetical protein
MADLIWGAIFRWASVRYVMNFFSQVGDLRRADMDISGCKQFNKGMIRQMIFKKGLSHINKDIVADVTTRWNYSGKLF